MKYCSRCVQPDTRPGIEFDKRGVCGACLYYEEMDKIDWNSRRKELDEIAKWAKKTTKSVYDCAIGISGGKDSTFQAIFSRDTLGLRPLLVNCEPENITEVGRRNIENLKNLGFDVISMRPNPVIMKKLVKRDFYKYLNPIKITEYPLGASTAIIANALKIPLIIQGENPTFTLGTSNLELRKHGGDAMFNNMKPTVSSGLKEYIDEGIDPKDLFLYGYDREKMIKDGFKGVFLQYYLREWSQVHNAEFSSKYGFRGRPEYFNPSDIGTYSPYFQLDSDLVQLNQMLKYLKFGFGQCTDHACYEVRDGRMTRAQALELVRRYDGKCSIRYIKEFCDYIDITVDEFWKVVDKFVNKDLFKKDKDGKWIPKFEVGVDTADSKKK